MCVLTWLVKHARGSALAICKRRDKRIGTRTDLHTCVMLETDDRIRTERTKQKQKEIRNATSKDKRSKVYAYTCLTCISGRAVGRGEARLLLELLSDRTRFCISCTSMYETNVRECGVCVSSASSLWSRPSSTYTSTQMCQVKI